MPLDISAKTLTLGTHRVRPLEQTWEIIQPYVATAGITRVADITWLDEFGIPVWQAIRPLGRSLSVAQGKGVSNLAAKVSAVMEAIECHYAENLSLETVVAPVREMSLPYDVMELPRVDGSLLHADTVLEWLPATLLASGRPTYAPKRSVDLNMVPDRYSPPLLQFSTNGLASGNSRAEALCHAIYELAERDATSLHWDALRRSHEMVHLPADGVAAELSAMITSRGARLDVYQLPSRFRIPTIGATIWSDTFPLPCPGWGSHLDPEVALCRAITEAAQTRLTLISGSRDDLRVHWLESLRASEFEEMPAPADATYREWSGAGYFAKSIDDDLRFLVTALEEISGRPLLAVDLAPADLDIAVVKVLGTGLHDRRASYA